MRRRSAIWAFVAALCAVAAAATPAAAGLNHPAADAVPWWLIGAGFAVASAAVVHVHVGRHAHTLTLSELPLVIGLLAAAPAALIAGAFAGNLVCLALYRRQPVRKLLFNVAVAVIDACAAAGVYAVLAGGERLSVRSSMAALAGACVASLLSAILVAAAVRLSGAAGQLRSLPGIVAWALGVTTLNALVAVAAARLVSDDALAAGLLLLPVAALVVAYRRHLEERVEHQRLRLLYESSRALQHARGTEAVLGALLRRARVVARADRAELVLLPTNSEGAVVRIVQESDGILVPGQAPWVGWDLPTAGEGRLVSRGQSAGALAERLRDQGTRDAVIVSLSNDHGVAGYLLVGNRASDVATFDADDLELMLAFAGQASVCIDNAQLEAELSDLAYHDSLTRLANRALFVRLVERALRRRVERGASAAVLYLDLDDFKVVNDGLGHVSGDLVLRAVAQRLVTCLRPEDTAARLGGDEFAVLLSDLDSASHAAAVADRLLDALGRPFVIDDTSVTLHASIGVALVEPGDERPEDILRRADVAMYDAKRGGKGRWALAGPQLEGEVVARHRLHMALEGAVERDEVRVHYQPIVSLPGGEVVGVEALVRWHHPMRGSVPADLLIDVAEQTGLIVPLGLMVLRCAVGVVAGWGGRPDLFLTVNVSGRQLRHAGFVDDVLAELEKAGLEPSRLVLEITERVMVERDPEVRRRLAMLRAHGVRIAIDDFGTGYSSLSCLRDLPVDILKIAKPFVDDLDASADRAAFAAAIIRLGQTLGLRVIAEGVERPEQARLLADLGCGWAQGYLFARPAAASAVEPLLLVAA